MVTVIIDLCNFYIFFKILFADAPKNVPDMEKHESELSEKERGITASISVYPKYPQGPEP